MGRLRRWFARLVHPHSEVDDARARVRRDAATIERHAKSIERSVDELEERTRQNHISASVEALLRRAR